jgi:hypothetical protein
MFHDALHLFMFVSHLNVFGEMSFCVFYSLLNQIIIVIAIVVALKLFMLLVDSGY